MTRDGVDTVVRYGGEEFLLILPDTSLADGRAVAERMRARLVEVTSQHHDVRISVKGFLEQVARPGFAIAADSRNPLRSGLLRGRSARVIVTMGMPAPVYRWFYGAHSLMSLERNILGFAGVKPVRSTLVGGAGAMTPAKVDAWRRRLSALGSAAR